MAVAEPNSEFSTDPGLKQLNFLITGRSCIVGFNQLNQRYMQVLFMFLLTLFSAFSFASEPLLPAVNLAEDGKIAAQKNQPIAILLLSSRVKSGRVLKEEALLPNLMSGVFDGKVMFREIAVNEAGTVVDFYGEALPRAEYKALFNISSLPALVFVNAEGEPLTTPLFSGAYEFYGFYLKRKLNEAMQALDNPTRFE